MLEEFLGYRLVDLGSYTFSVQQVMHIAIILIITKLFLLFIKKGLLKIENVRIQKNENLLTVIKIINYIVWVASIAYIIRSFGFNVTTILTGSAALLVGVGLGLQQTFNDFISGVILLFEGKTKIGDILEVEGRLIKITNIGLRTTEGYDKDDRSFFVPNSKIVTDKVINLTHFKGKRNRFKVKVGVAYGSDVEKVIQILEKCAKNHHAVIEKEHVEARFVEFGDSSLNFELLFFSKTVLANERTKSDIRRMIDKEFRENNISIPFPQMDLHMKN